MTEGREQNELHRQIGEAISMHFGSDTAVNNTRGLFDEILGTETGME
ncbi:hypothetical protein M0P65_02130 [Candidatus Gracilibacteria bacterium]|nr:hypothetical protein [Candidatus Gracilibacteria bacterium]